MMLTHDDDSEQRSMLYWWWWTGSLMSCCELLLQLLAQQLSPLMSHVFCIMFLWSELHCLSRCHSTNIVTLPAYVTGRESVSTCFYCASYASAVLGVVILSVHLSHACFVTNPKNRPAIFFTPHERAITLVFCCQRSQRNSNGVTPKGGAKERWGRLKRRLSTNIPGTADRLKRCQLSSPVSGINFWRSAAMPRSVFSTWAE